MLSIYANYPVMDLLSETERERETVAVNMQVTVFTLAGLKIIPSYRQELV